MADLKKLKEERSEILKAELAAWLHDMGKCADAFLLHEGRGFNARICHREPRVNPHKATFDPNELRTLPYWNELTCEVGRCSRMEEAKHSTALWRTLQNIGANIPSISITVNGLNVATLKELILWGRPLVSTYYQKFKSTLGNELAYLSAILGRSHSSAHMEKEDEADGGQSSGYSSSFGYYVKNFENLDDKLRDIIINSVGFLTNRQNVLQVFKKNMQTAPGDTRRPINEVTLWDWSSIVAALYKAEIARCVITGEKRDPKDVKWRLLSIRTDGLGYLLSANSIPDILARKELLKDAFDKVQKLLEEEYPLGLEVYRDENGSVFVVPDLEDLLDPDHNDKTLREFILERFQSGTVKGNPRLAIQGEIVPEIYLDKKAWWGQDPEWKKKKKQGTPPDDELPPIGEHLKETPTLQADPSWVQGQWKGNEDEICSVCGLRPIGPSDKAKSRRVCDVCEERRADRSKEWADRLDTTIWIDEVSDKNGRIALIVGRFDLTHWLNGTLVRTLAVREPNDQNGHTADEVAKNPSFARLRRIWETTRKFWEEVEGYIKDRTKKQGGRYYFEVLNNPDLGPYHAYEIHIGRVKIPVLWDTDNKRLWIIDNPEYLSSENQLGENLYEVLKRYEYKTITLYDPVGYGRKSHEAAKVKVGNLKEINKPYSAYIPILTEPQVFMAVVPADKALEILKEIKAKYEREMGKVRNRLPLHLGVVFAPRMMPLRAVLDAGRRMLKQKAKPEEWKVVCVTRKQISKGDQLPERFEKDKDKDKYGQFGEWYEVLLEAKSEPKAKRLTWFVPALMGDGQTEDRWYPYVFLASSDEPTDRKRYYRTDLSNPWNPNHPWLVHVGELKPRDTIYFTPATFDFIFMDNNRRRFDVAYTEDGRRRYKGHWSRPYLLDELEDLTECWGILGTNLSSNRQVFQIRNLIETKREEWFEKPKESVQDETFRRFCEAVIRNAEWKEKPSESTVKKLNEWAVSGLLSDCVELHHHILKLSAADDSG